MHLRRYDDARRSGRTTLWELRQRHPDQTLNGPRGNVERVGAWAIYKDGGRAAEG